MVHSSAARPVASLVALVIGLLVAAVPRGAEAAPSCPPGATLVTTDQTILSAHTTDVKCVGAGVLVSEDIQAYGSSTIFTSADVGVDVETYGTATIHVLGGHVGENIDAYVNSTINIYDVDLDGHASAYSNSTVNVFGGDIGGRLIIYSDGLINVFASSLSSHAFGDVTDTSGTLAGILEDGSAFSLLFSRHDGGELRLIQVPEPGSFSLLVFSIAGVALARRRRR